MSLPDFPIDESALSNIEHALGGAYEVDEEGNHTLVGADFTLHQLLDFYSGYDERLEEPVDEWQEYREVPIMTYPEPVYHVNDVVRALIKEIRRLRNKYES